MTDVFRKKDYLQVDCLVEFEPVSFHSMMEKVVVVPQKDYLMWN
jgi:hypothetical protein